MEALYGQGVLATLARYPSLKWVAWVLLMLFFWGVVRKTGQERSQSTTRSALWRNRFALAFLGVGFCLTLYWTLVESLYRPKYYLSVEPVQMLEEHAVVKPVVHEPIIQKKAPMLLPEMDVKASEEQNRLENEAAKRAFMALP
ncbi:hypothetical protein ACQZV8_08460 [Magnetococcales bacterium HHB-1]